MSRVGVQVCRSIVAIAVRLLSVGDHWGLLRGIDNHARYGYSYRGGCV